MNLEKKLIWQDHSGQGNKRFLQPLAVALVCAVFIALILVMGIMDLRRSDTTLQGFMENQGQSLIGIVQRLTQDNLNAIKLAHQRGGVDTFVPLGNETFLPHKWLTNALAELGREIDGKWKAGGLNSSSLSKYAVEKNVWLIALLDRRGRMVFQSQPVTPLVLEDGTKWAVGKLDLEQIHRLSEEQKIGFIALRRRDGSGTVIILLDREGLRYWIMKVAAEKALEKFGEGQGQGLLYLVLQNHKNMLFDHTGLMPEPWKPGEIEQDEILSGQRKIQSRKTLFQGKNILDMAVPLSLNGQIVGIARLGMELDSTEAILKENKRNIFIFMFFIVATALLSMWFLYRTQNRHLAGIVEIERRLEKAERLSALGQLAAGVAHEIRNPLNAISMASQRMKREFIPSEETRKKEFDTFNVIIRDEIRRLDGIIEEFLAFSKTRRLELRSYPVVEVLQKIINLIHEEAATKGINIITHWDNASYAIPMDMDKLQQAMLNFFKNAMESITGGGSINVFVKPNGKDHITISIADTGCGIQPEEMEKIFSPEYTTKEKGLGLGLSLAHEIIRGHGGEIRVYSQPGAGTQFDVILPKKKTNGKG